MDLATSYRSLVWLHFPNARLVADRFHVIRIIHHHFLARHRSGRQQESRFAVADAPPPPPSAPRSAAPARRLSGKMPRLGTHLPVSAAALLPAVEETPHPTAM